MHIEHNIPLSALTTMRLGGTARDVMTVTSKEELKDAIAYARERQLPFFVMGGGSNIVASCDEYKGLIILSRITGFTVLDEDKTTVTIQIGAGENWDQTVERVVKMNLSGIEAMSAIPGTVGATPVQNVGAYGQEIADTFVELEALDTQNNEWTVIDKESCEFSYRNSIFKDPAKRHHIITSVTLRLNKHPMNPPFYDSLQRYLDQQSITDYSPASIRSAVIAVRSNKLPDPTKIANTGSFFKNPLVTKQQADELLASFPAMPQFPMKNGDVKLAAGWLIEQAGLKAYAAHGLRTYEENALVVVNDSATDYTDLQAFTAEIINGVKETFGVTLEQEPETL